MKTKQFITLFIFALVMGVGSAMGQTTVALHSATGVTIFQGNELATAVQQAQAGDTIYLSSGLFTVTSLDINKRLIIFGVGHSPAQTLATGHTQVNGDIRLLSGSDQSLISGIFFAGNIQVGTTAANQVVANVTIKRCRIGGMLRLTADPHVANRASNFYITENIIHILDGSFTRNHLIRQNVILNEMRHFSENNFFQNNIIGRTHHITGSTFSNNVILVVSAWNSALETDQITSSIFNNNVFVPNVVFGASNQGAHTNLINQPLANIFVNFAGQTTFSDEFNFNLKPEFAGNNFGTDGTDVGIFGTSTPFKANYLPVVPHIKSKTIAPQTDAAGKLSVQIEVEAQRN